MQAYVRAAILSVARATTPDGLAHGVVATLATEAVVLARIWLARSDALDLAGSAGSPAGGGSYTRIDGDFRRVAIGAGKIGEIAATRQPRLATRLRGDEPWLANPGWIARQGVRAFLGFPLVADDRLQGVLAIFSRTSPSDGDIDDLQLLADLTAARAQSVERDVARDSSPADRTASPAESSAARDATDTRDADHPIVTRAELRAIERQTIAAALARTGGKVFGADGAAALLGMKPTTLASRIKALGIR